MLKILVCVKQVPDVDQMRMDPETGNLIRAGVPAILNPLDGNALAAALSVKEQYGAELSLITMGPPAAEAALRECLAAGADRAILGTDRAFGNADTLATSYSIVSAAKSIDSFDLIFCGKETLDGATGQMGAQLAERFGAAQVTSASLIKSVDEAAGKLVVERELETGVETLEVSMPCLFTMEKTRPRLPHSGAAPGPARAARAGPHHRRGFGGRQRGQALRAGRDLRRCPEWIRKTTRTCGST